MYTSIFLLKENFLKNAIIQYNNPSNGYKYNIIEATLVFNGKKIMITVYSGINNEKDQFGSEYYSGSNYIVDSSDKSFSKNFKNFNKLPKNLIPIVKELIPLHNKKYNTNLSI